MEVSSLPSPGIAIFLTGPPIPFDDGLDPEFLDQEDLVGGFIKGGGFMFFILIP